MGDEDSGSAVESVDLSAISVSDDDSDGSHAPVTPSGPPGNFVANIPMQACLVRKNRRARRCSCAEAQEQALDEKCTAESDEDEKTALIIKRLPDQCTRDSLCAMLDASGFAGLYNFVYLPVNFKTWQRFQYSIVNFVSSVDALAALESLNTTTPQWPQQL